MEETGDGGASGSGGRRTAVALTLLTVASPLDPHEQATLIFDSGPLTRKEIKKLSNDRAYEYFQVMNAILAELGPEAFVARRAELREAALRKIVNR